jgi:3-oxoacyl-[acyl-carrier-protein] synthase-1
MEGYTLNILHLQNRCLHKIEIENMMHNTKVVITGMGIWSCLGTSLDEVRQSLYNGRSGIGIDPARLEYGYRSALTGVVERPALKGVIERRLRIGLSEEAEYAFMASRDAFHQAGIDDDYMLNNEIGIIFGNDSSAKPVIEAANIMAEKHDSALLGSGLIFQSMNSTVNMNLSTIFHLRGINFTVSAACASGSHSIGLGYMLIKQGFQDMVLCGGAQETNYYSMATFDALNTFSIRMDEPTKASRPFDRDRDGLIPSGGAAALVLESYEHAVARGANILAEVCGYGFSSNGEGISQPSDNGSVIAMTRALNDAGMTADDIDYINAHATSTPQGDMFEAIALERMFAGKHALISSTKSMTGHECWMAGASEIVYSILMMQHHFVAPNINLEHPDEHAAKLNLTARTVDTEVNTVLSNSFGFGGTNSALVIRKI